MHCRPRDGAILPLARPCKSQLAEVSTSSAYPLALPIQVATKPRSCTYLEVALGIAPGRSTSDAVTVSFKFKLNLNAKSWSATMICSLTSSFKFRLNWKLHCGSPSPSHGAESASRPLCADFCVRWPVHWVRHALRPPPPGPPCLPVRWARRPPRHPPCPWWLCCARSWTASLELAMLPWRTWAPVAHPRLQLLPLAWVGRSP
jgi:hypothetical protein